jgi:hypothetical protein
VSRRQVDFVDPLKFHESTDSYERKGLLNYYYKETITKNYYKEKKKLLREEELKFRDSYRYGKIQFR